MATEVERLATLEAKMNTVVVQLEELKEDTESIKRTLGQQRGFVAGALAVLTPIWALLIVFAEKVWTYLTAN